MSGDNPSRTPPTFVLQDGCNKTLFAIRADAPVCKTEASVLNVRGVCPIAPFAEQHASFETGCTPLSEELQASTLCDFFNDADPAVGVESLPEVAAPKLARWMPASSSLSARLATFAHSVPMNYVRTYAGIRRTHFPKLHRFLR